MLIVQPSVEYRYVNSLVHSGMRAIGPLLRRSANRAIISTLNELISAFHQLAIGVCCLRLQNIAVNFHSVFEGKAVMFCLAHHPTQRNLGKQVARVATAYVPVSADKSSLLHT